MESRAIIFLLGFSFTAISIGMYSTFYDLIGNNFYGVFMPFIAVLSGILLMIFALRGKTI